MKLNKSLLVAALSLAFAGYASGQCTVGSATKIYVTGSTAFRGATVAAIEACLNVGFVYGAWSESSTVAPYPNARQTASYLNYYGTLATDGSCVIIKCAFSGSEAGYKDLKNCSLATGKENFVDDTIVSYGSANVDSTSAPGNTGESANVDIAMADNSQPFAQLASRTPVLANTCKAGIVPFVWVKNAQTTADITANPDYSDLVNVTHPALQLAITGGARLAQFTGVAGETKFVYVAGRDNNSGTRANALLDLGFATTASIEQTMISGSSGSSTIVLGPLGSSGQSSGGTLAKSMFITGSASATDTIQASHPTGWYAVAYLGLADAATAVAGGAVKLTLNGVTESDATIENGDYTFWGNEYCCLSSCDALGSEAGKLYTCMCGEFPSGTTDPYEIPLTAMHCSKTPDSAYPVYTQ